LDLRRRVIDRIAGGQSRRGADEDMSVWVADLNFLFAASLGGGVSRRVRATAQFAHIYSRVSWPALPGTARDTRR
jgi:hypothetical protein